MTNNDPITASTLADARDRRSAYWAKAKAQPLEMPAPRPVPPNMRRTRRTSVRHRAIR